MQMEHVFYGEWELLKILADLILPQQFPIYLLATGNYRRPGAGAYPLRGHNNVQGACDMGTLPGWLPGYQHVTDDAAREKFERAYGVEIGDKPGLDNIQMLHCG